eukprot:355000-Chlamydomonas_euryale.AAC.2
MRAQGRHTMKKGCRSRSGWVGRTLREKGATSSGPIPGDPPRSTQIRRPPISIGIDRTMGTVGDVLKPLRTALEMVPGVPRHCAGKSLAPGWLTAPQLLPHHFPQRQVVKQPQERERNGNALANQPGRD